MHSLLLQKPDQYKLKGFLWPVSANCRASFTGIWNETVSSLGLCPYPTVCGKSKFFVENCSQNGFELIAGVELTMPNHLMKRRKRFTVDEMQSLSAAN